jgi:predicted alpha/beta hydrolase family esterase
LKLKSKTVLISAGYKGSDEHHWQSWIQHRVPHSYRVKQSWNDPQIKVWADNIGQHIDEAIGAVVIVAHSFGCLASVLAASTRAEKVAALMLVAPADPRRFCEQGLIHELAPSTPVSGIDYLLPQTVLRIPSLMITSTDDPWLSETNAVQLASRWGSKLVVLERAGHINVASGFGTWPAGLQYLNELRAQTQFSVLGDFK